MAKTLLDDAEMANGEFASLRELLPKLMMRWAQEGKPVPIAPLWREVVGDTLARVTSVVSLREGELTIRVASITWAKELRRREDALKERLSSRWGYRAISRIVFLSP